MVPLGFRFAGINAGIKAARKDMALVACQVPCATAGTFTINKARAAAVDIAARAVPSQGVQAIVINSGNANALTGKEGHDDVLRVQAEVAKHLGVPDSAVLSASTGVIGVRLPVGKMIEAAPSLVKGLAPALEPAAEAIMTTDTRPKIARRVLYLGGKEVRVAAFAKGSGMIAPSMATMICVITTDAVIDSALLQTTLDDAVGASFNRIVVDGDMSTNDCVFMLASGLAGNRALEGSELEEFSSALRFLCIELARAIAEDGEGATKLVEVRVEGAPDEQSAKDVSTAIAGSSLVKAALFGADPNWGRVLSTVGARAASQGFAIDPAKAKVTIQGTCVYDGGPSDHDSVALRARMREPQVAIVVKLADGKSAATAWGCDLSYDYVKINADYTSTIATSPEGTVTRDDRLTNYSPAFKRTLLVEALSYIAKFSGKRAVVKYGGAAMIKDALKASFARDVNLLRSAGLLPVVVHGGGPEFEKTLEKLGKGPESRDQSSARMVEMVMTGRINTELVTMLNSGSQNGGSWAVGLSGKDGGMIRANKDGSIAEVNKDLIEMMLAKHYVPVISPFALGEDGEGHDVGADAVAAEIAIAIGAEKLIYLTDVPGVLENKELVTAMTAAEAKARIESGGIRGGMAIKVTSALRALSGGVRSVHVIDGRAPHTVIAELFTDSGVGTHIHN